MFRSLSEQRKIKTEIKLEVRDKQMFNVSKAKALCVLKSSNKLEEEVSACFKFW